MATKKRRSTKTTIVATASRPFPWAWAGVAAAAFLAVFWAYGPALHGPFLFDDANLPYGRADYSPSLLAWIGGGVRGLLLFTYWLNAQVSQGDPFSFHVTGVLIHVVAAALVFLIVRRLLEWAKSEAASRNLMAGLAAALFLLHPAQAEAVAYIAGRSEALSTMFFLAAFTVFLYRRNAEVRWSETAAVLVLFLAALLSKEQTVVLPAVLLLTDYWWNPGFSLSGIRRNWRLYLPVLVGAPLAGAAVLWKVMASAETAGFRLKDFTWYQYFFTQCRALFVYIRIFLFPAGLNADWNFPISRTILDHGAILGLLALVALAAVAWIYRRRFPLATYGFLLYLLLMSPTSSILPIQDAVAERRLYFSMLGLLLIVVDLVGRLHIDRRQLAYGGAAVALIAAIATHARAGVWSDPVRLWEDTAQKSPHKFRARFQLGFAYYDLQRFDAAVAQFQKAGDLPARDIRERNNLLVDWGLALDGVGRPADAIAKLREAASTEPTAHIYSQIGMIYAKQSQWAQALAALERAQQIDPGFTMTYIYRGQIFERTNNLPDAIVQFQKALELEPDNEQVRQELLRLRSLPPAGRGQ